MRELFEVLARNTGACDGWERPLKRGDVGEESDHIIFADRDPFWGALEISSRGVMIINRVLVLTLSLGRI